MDAAVAPAGAVRSIQGEGDSPSATRPMRTEARAVLTDVLRDAHHWLDELSTSPKGSSAGLGWIRQDAFGTVLHDGSGAVVKASAPAEEVRGSNPLSSTRKSAQIDLISYGTG